MACLVFNLISFKESYFVKACYYTLAKTSNYSWPPLEIKIYSYWKWVELGNKSNFNWCSNSIQIHLYDVKWFLRSLNMWRTIFKWLDNIFGGRVSLPYEEICRKIFLFLKVLLDARKLTTYTIKRLLSLNRWEFSDEFVNFDDGRTWILKMPALSSKDTVSSSTQT